MMIVVGVASRSPSLVQRLLSLAAIAVVLPTLAAVPVQADTRPGAAVKAATGDDRPDPLLAVVSLSRQRIRVYDRTGIVARSRVSTGMRGHRTPAGVFSILQRRRHHHSNIYSNAPMPYMQRLTWSGIALHAGVVPRYPASHGCIRLPFPFAAKLWKMTEIGTPVVVVPDDTSPVPIQHARLPVPRFTPASPEQVRQAGGDGPARHGPALASAGTTVTDAGAEAGLAGVRLLSPLERVRAFKARARADAAAAKKAVRRAMRKARARRAEARRAAKARERAEQALAAARRRHERAVEAAKASSLERARAVARARAGLAAAEAALAAARMKADEARLLHVVWADDAAERADPGQARRAARARERAERALSAAQRRHEEAVEDAETSVSERARASAQAEAAVAAAEAALATAAMAADEARLLDVVREDAAAAAAAARIGAKRASRMAAAAYKATRRIERPISILVSRKEERVFIRQAWKPIHEAPVTFKDGPPLGTHVYLAMGPTADGGSMDWLSVSLPARRSARASRRRDRTEEAASASAVPAETAATVLERFKLPEATRRFIADRLWAGAALIVSDQGLGHETGEYTDFIVVTR